MLPSPAFIPRYVMAKFWPRLLKVVLPVSVVCGGAGYLYAVAAGAYIADARDDGGTLRDTLVWRVPFAMAFWGGSFTLLVEFFRHLWGANNKPEKSSAPAVSPDAEAEKLLLQLLEQAETAEQSRAIATPADRPLPLPPALSPDDLPVPTFLSAPAAEGLEQRA